MCCVFCVLIHIPNAASSLSFIVYARIWKRRGVHISSEQAAGARRDLPTIPAHYIDIKIRRSRGVLLGGLLSLGSQVGGGRGALEVAGEDRLDEGVEDNLSSAVRTMAVSYQK